MASTVNDYMNDQLEHINETNGGTNDIAATLMLITRWYQDQDWYPAAGDCLIAVPEVLAEAIKRSDENAIWQISDFLKDLAKLAEIMQRYEAANT